MKKDYELVGEAVRFTPHYDIWYGGISEEVVESYRGLTGVIESVVKGDEGNTAVKVRWDEPTPEMGSLFRTGFGGPKNCSCQECELKNRSDLEILSNSI